MIPKGRHLTVSALILIAFCSVGCTTGYWVDRGRDAADVFTGTLGGGIGAKTRIGPFRTGLIANMDVMGLRGGRLLVDRSEFPSLVDLEAVIMGMDWAYYARDRRAKGYSTSLIAPYGVVPFIRLPDEPGTCASYYTQIEVVVACWLGFRLGFNPGELLDLALGFVGLDIYNDDLERQQE